MKGKDFKGFWIKKPVNKAFIIKCVELEINQGDVLELLVMKWLDMRNKTESRKVEIYGKSK